ncbi:hypothetical protein [Microbacterium sp.]|uniref:hypothetical protein n=1 Tax=Microbacterium sp. TaxID=51671 RepID=UPI0025FA7912|nr:hypothetical protein [Microbacterium sp.]
MRKFSSVFVLLVLLLAGCTSAPVVETLQSKMNPYETSLYAGATLTHQIDVTPDFTGSPTAVLWDDFSKIRYPAGTPVSAVAGNPHLYGCKLTGTGGDNPQSLYGSFRITAEKFALMVTAWASTDITIYVDRKPLTVDPYLVPEGQYFVVADDLGAGSHLVEFILGWGANFMQVVAAPSARVTPGPAPTFTIGITGDSFADSGLAPYYAGLSREIHRLTGWTPIQLGQGSTGYTNDGASSGDASKSVFGSPQRLAALEAQDPDVVLVIGSVNDGAAATAVVKSAAAAYYEALAPRPVIVAGVEPVYAADDPTYSDWDAVNAEIIAAADAAPNVIAVIDWRGEDWLTGTGSVSDPQGDGNQDTYIGDVPGTDTSHPGYQGQRYLAERFVERIMAIPWSGAGPSTE